MRLGRILAGLAPDEPEVHGLVALMEIQASRSRARTGPDGEPVLLLDQNRGLWDQLLIRRGLAALPAPRRSAAAIGPYALQAAIAACHARARTPDETDWRRIAALYRVLVEVTPSPIVELNRADGGRHGGRSGRRPRDRRRRWLRSRRSRPIICCPACAATCWSSSAGRPRRGRNSSGLPR